MIREERPTLLTEEQASLRAFARQLADWIRQPEGRDMHRVVGVYGGRGTGKTSVLMTVLEELQRAREPAEANGKLVRILLPNVEVNRALALDREREGDQERALARGHVRTMFAPSDTRDSDDLLFLLLAHLEELYLRPGHVGSAFQDARVAEVRRKDITRFLHYEQEVSPSSREIPGRFIDIHDKVARTTLTLRREFDKIVDACRENGQTLVLFIDDLDLQPHRALELLEILNLFLDQPGVTVLVAADRDSLLHSIDDALQQRRSHRYPGLAAALLAKYVPHAWALPMPSEDERMEILWPSTKTPGSPFSSELARWWPNADREHARQKLGPLLPRTYRELWILHNLLATLRGRYAQQGTNPVKLDQNARNRLISLSISDTWLPSVLVMMAALDAQYPQVSPLSWLLDEPGDLAEALNELVPADDALEGNDRGSRAAFELPARVRRRIAPPYLDEIAQIHAQKKFIYLLLELRALRTGLMAPDTRFLAVSLNADAMAMAEPVWQEHFDRDEVTAWHIDLRGLVRNLNNVEPQEIEAAHERARDMLRERGVIDSQHPIWLHIKARLSLAIWLGWELRYLREVKAYNWFNGELVPFEAPLERIRFRDTGQYQRLTPEPRPSLAETFEQAVVLIDVIGSSTPGNLYEFEQTDDIPAQHRYRLSALPGQVIEQEDVLPLLDDAIELLGHLRRDNGVQHFHLAFAGPDFMAFFLGRQLNAMGRITLYDYYADAPRYRRVFTIDTNG